MQALAYRVGNTIGSEQAIGPHQPYQKHWNKVSTSNKESDIKTDRKVHRIFRFG